MKTSCPSTENVNESPVKGSSNRSLIAALLQVVTVIYTDIQIIAYNARVPVRMKSFLCILTVRKLGREQNINEGWGVEAHHHPSSNFRATRLCSCFPSYEMLAMQALQITTAKGHDSRVKAKEKCSSKCHDYTQELTSLLQYN